MLILLAWGPSLDSHRMCTSALPRGLLGLARTPSGSLPSFHKGKTVFIIILRPYFFTSFFHESMMVFSRVSSNVCDTLGFKNEGRFFFLFGWLLFISFHSLLHMEVLRLGVESELQLGLMPQPQQHQIQATPATYTAPCGNVGSLTHKVRPGIRLNLQTQRHCIGFLTR